MSSVVTALTGGGGKGMAFNADSANIVQPATMDQANQQYGNLNQGLAQQQAFLQAVQGQNGLQNQSNVYNQMQGVANGTGPNPAQAMLNNTTGANVANQAALMASQRGSNANVGMMARQAANQGANIQQQAAGQGAALQANQSMNALNSMGTMAGQQVANQANATNAYGQATQGAYGQVTGNVNAQNNANVGMQSNMNSVNGAIQGEVAKQQGALVGNMMGGVGSAMNMFGGAGGSAGGAAGGLGGGLGALGAPIAMVAAHGGQVPTMPSPSGPRSKVGQHLHAYATGGTVAALVSPGEKYLSPEQAAQVMKGQADPMTAGTTIPGKPAVPGATNSYQNDTVSAKLESGGIVLPRSVTMGKDAEAKAQAFVRAHFAQRRGK